jgi:hypothetical protein
MHKRTLTSEGPFSTSTEPSSPKTGDAVIKTTTRKTPANAADRTILVRIFFFCITRRYLTLTRSLSKMIFSLRTILIILAFLASSSQGFLSRKKVVAPSSSAESHASACAGPACAGHQTWEEIQPYNPEIRDERQKRSQKTQQSSSAHETYICSISAAVLALALLGRICCSTVLYARGDDDGNDPEPPFSGGKDAAPLWLAVILGVVKLLRALGRLPLVKVPYQLCSNLVFFVGKVPFHFECLAAQRGERVRRDVAYGDRPRNRLDIYLPDSSRGLPGHAQYGRAVVMMVHGGAWFFGDKLYFAKVQEASFSECTVVAVNYTLHPHATCEEMLVDVSKAIAWTLNNICRPTHDDHGAVPLVVFGHSSGAHLVMLCAAYR